MSEGSLLKRIARAEARVVCDSALSRNGRLFAASQSIGPPADVPKVAELQRAAGDVNQQLDPAFIDATERSAAQNQRVAHSAVISKHEETVHRPADEGGQKPEVRNEQN